MLGETFPWSLAGAGAGALLLAAWTLEWAWWRPWRLGRILRSQGIRGTRYRLLAGDVQEEARLNREAWSRPLPIGSHDTGPRVLPILYRTMKEHGKLSFTWSGPTPRVMIQDPELVREVLSSKSSKFAPKKFPRVSRLLADGIITKEGEEWAKRRKILNPAFHQEKIKRMLPVFSTCCKEMIARWQNSVTSEGFSELDVGPEFRNLTGDVISRTAFGSSYEEGKRIFQLQEEQIKCIMIAFQTVFIPGYWLLPTKNNRRMKEINREISQILHRMIRKRNRNGITCETGDGDLLSLLVESNMRQSNGKANLGMTTEDIIEECKVFHVAGMETTSILLTWTIIVLSMHQDWQELAREEVFHHLGRTAPDFGSLSHLKIVTMILYEVLRLYPPVSLLTRRTYKEVELGGIKYPAGVDLLLPTIFIQHDPDIWGNDASKFNPGRFSEGVSKASKEQGAFFPFGMGPRICIGQNFALLEAKIALATILQHFYFELSPSYAHAPHTVLSLQPQHGSQIKLKKL